MGKKNCDWLKALIMITGFVALVAGICFAVVKCMKHHSECDCFDFDDDFDDDFDEDDDDDEQSGYAREADFEK